MIAKYLIENFDTKIAKYFTSSDWKDIYAKKIKTINHDEPWLTLIACYSIFSNQENISSESLSAFNHILENSGISKSIHFSHIKNVRIEEKLPEIISYRLFLAKVYKDENFHLYPDRREKIDKKILAKTASFEGNTNLDLLIEGVANGEKSTCFIEAKFLSDISYQISYNPIRDQIIRNIDSGIDYVENKKHVDNFKNFYFFLLTPELFKTERFGCKKQKVKRLLGIEYSRLYSYKLEEYKDWKKLKQALPHRNLSNLQWEIVADNIGWISYDDFYSQSANCSIIENENEMNMIKLFFEERNLI